MKDAAAQARRAVRTSNFTQQTNTLDVDKHMMEYIEENIKKMRNAPDLSEDIPADASESEHKSDKWNIEKKLAEEGSVTNSMAMLTAIPEVDLGMDARLKNIEETEKAKRIHAEERKEKKRVYNDEEHLAANRFFRPNLRQKTDAEIMRDAQREAMGLPPIQERQRNYERPQMSTDEAVMERFKKRMRK
ncbi:hypothetical protein CONPUDRAFT_130968 [Coniophora puteana RWD-64-598 SS2]|uniref:Uncharacterized protein n=1 Tax=Coniophora puteana (strain RWD-64-598) TaxID=741705 RepID=A0A5M3MAR6_CONPW|nr:uncharacterized protein CONPUDRAFT_130968 [Coniophora puteana RWD-64-598 SS2]EIW76372.1 hypothetical protein CONPUDRAFT_130968 [Coniophora puteana RWD-64-598 SS2]